MVLDSIIMKWWWEKSQSNLINRVHLKRFQVIISARIWTTIQKLRQIWNYDHSTIKRLWIEYWTPMLCKLLSFLVKWTIAALQYHLYFAWLTLISLQASIWIEYVPISGIMTVINGIVPNTFKSAQIHILLRKFC